MDRTLRTQGSFIAFCGTRGIPANYGGFETAVDEISRRFVAKGAACEVFCRRSSAREPATMHEGRCLVHVRGSRFAKFDTVLSSVRTGWYLARHRRRYRHVFWFNNANFPGILMTWLAGIPMSVNTDGLEWRRAKWSWPFKVYSFLCSFLVSRICRTLISDSRAIQEYYWRRFHRKTTMIPYGVPDDPLISREGTERVLAEFGVHSGQYFLQITRIEPDNLPLSIATAFRDAGLSDRGYTLLMVGYRESTPYAGQLMALDGQHGIKVCRAIYDPEILYILRKNCYCYVHGNSVGGTNPALLEAMASCPRVMALDTVFSREVLGESGLYFESTLIELGFREALETEDRSKALQRRVRQWYDWDAVADSYLRLANGIQADYRVPAESESLVRHREMAEVG
ncbi:MAG TPA: DUF1972 domain-containing protein [Candidatus Deferrimicrobium sp.]|nr:DUF1972 domain-containing protein [Candidatus Deferrimicrobium sp.]